MSVIVKAGLKKQTCDLPVLHLGDVFYFSLWSPLQRSVILKAKYTEILMQVEKKTSIKTNLICVCVFLMNAAVLIVHLMGV